MNKEAAYVPYTQIVSKLPISKGDMLYVISDILGLAKVCRDNGEKFDCAKFIESLQEVVGESGTLLFPTFNWDFCKGIVFDYHNTKGKTGVLGNTALKMSDFRRTQHPLYSFAVWGKAQQDLITLSNYSGFGIDSPFAYMKESNAKALVIGLTASIGNSFIHYVEEVVGVKYRSEKDFCAPYIDENGSTENRTYSMYVRNLDLNPQHTTFSAIDDVMSILGISQDVLVNGIPFHIVDLCGMFEVVSLELRYNKANNLYSFKVSVEDVII